MPSKIINGILITAIATTVAIIPVINNIPPITNHQAAKHARMILTKTVMAIVAANHVIHFPLVWDSFTKDKTFVSLKII